MAIEIPNIFRGKPVDGAIEIALKKTAVNPPAPDLKGTPPSPSNLSDAGKYLILEGRKHGSYEYPDLLVGMERDYLGKDWNDAHTALNQNNSYMLTIRQFVDFLSLLKSGSAYDGKGNKVDKRKLDSILDEIVTVRNPWRSEWLDAKFKNGNIIYHNLVGNPSSLVEVREPLSAYLDKDKTPGINLDNWLKEANQHGLPKKTVDKGKMYYWAPADGAVAGFLADSVRALLYCGRDPTDTNASLGVRPVRKKI